MTKPDVVRTLTGGPYKGCDLEFYAEPARSRTVLCGQDGAVAMIMTPDLYVTRMRLDKMRLAGRGPSDLVGLVCVDGDGLYASRVAHADSFGFVCVGGTASTWVTRGVITPSDAVWMTSFTDVDDGHALEVGMREVRVRYVSTDGLVEAIQNLPVRQP